MNMQWETTKAFGLKHSNRWGHSSATLPNNLLVLYGGYADSNFLKDVWVFNPTKNAWAQVKFAQNSINPSERSNCSFIYSEAYDGIIMFGGGSHQNSKLNDLWCLRISQSKQSNIFEGRWEQLYPQNGKVPWGRTYHVSEMFNNYLVIHGGQSYTGEIDDFWALNLENMCWVQLKNQLKHQARKFHSSAIVKQKLYIIGGIFGSYQTINKIQFVDLGILKSSDLQTIEDHRFQWKQVDLNGPLSNMIGRWGHVSKVYQNNVYIFGGRTSVQQNDLLIFSPKKNHLQKVSALKVPQGRRKPCAWLIGSVMIINSGYNGTYLSDQYWIDLRFTKQSLMTQKIATSQNIHKKQLCDIHINTADNKYIDMYSKFIRNSFQTEEDMIGMIEELAQMKHQVASKYVEILSNGVYLSKNITNQDKEELIFSNKTIPNDNKFNYIDERKLKKFKITFSTNQLLANKKKILFNVVKQSTVMNLNPFKLIRVANQEFNRIFKEIQSDCCCDLRITFCQQKAKTLSNSTLKVIKCCRYPLVFRSEYFRNVIEGVEKRTNAKRGEQIELEITGNEIEFKLMKAVVLYCYYGHVIIPKDLSLVQCISLFKLAKKFSLEAMMSIAFAEIKELIFSKDIDEWINSKLNKKQNSNIFNKFNPQKGSQNHQTLNYSSLDFEFISEKQFEEMIAFCVSQSKILNKKLSKSPKMASNKWEQILFYLTSRFAQLEFKKHVQQLLRCRLEESRLIKRQSKLRNSMKRTQSNKENVNSSNKQKQNLSESILMQKETKDKDTNEREEINRKGYFDMIVGLVRANLVDQIGNQKKYQMKEIKHKDKGIKENEVKVFFQRAIIKQRIESQFKFKKIYSELLKT